MNIHLYRIPWSPCVETLRYAVLQRYGYGYPFSNKKDISRVAKILKLRPQKHEIWMELCPTYHHLNMYVYTSHLWIEWNSIIFIDYYDLIDSVLVNELFNSNPVSLPAFLFRHLLCCHTIAAVPRRMFLPNWAEWLLLVAFRPLAVVMCIVFFRIFGWSSRFKIPSGKLT